MILLYPRVFSVQKYSLLGSMSRPQSTLYIYGFINSSSERISDLFFPYIGILWTEDFALTIYCFQKSLSERKLEKWSHHSVMILLFLWALFCAKVLIAWIKVKTTKYTLYICSCINSSSERISDISPGQFLCESTHCLDQSQDHEVLCTFAVVLIHPIKEYQIYFFLICAFYGQRTSLLLFIFSKIIV